MRKIHIVHGWTYSLEGWTGCVSELRKLGFDPILHRVPGLTEPSDKVWTLEEYTDWLAKELKDEKDIVLVGHSNGGRISIIIAARASLPISRLVLIDAAGIVHNEFPLRLKRAVFGFLAKLGKPLAAIPGIRKIYYRLIGAGDYGRAPENMRATMKNLISIDLLPKLQAIKIPTLIIWGRKDSATPVSDAYAMNAAIAGSNLVVLDDARHSPHMSHPTRVAKEISDFVA